MRRDEEAARANEVDADERHKREHHALTREKDGIGKQARLPLVHGRQPAWRIEMDDQLTGDAAGEEKGEEDQKGAVERRVFYDHCR